MKNIGKTTEKNGIKTFYMSLKEIADLCSSDTTFRESWGNYKVKTTKEYIDKRFEEAIINTPIPLFIRENKDLTVLITCESNCEGNITRYPHRDFATDLVTAFKFSILQNIDVTEWLAYEFNYILKGSQIKLLLPHSLKGI